MSHFSGLPNFQLSVKCCTSLECPGKMRFFQGIQILFRCPNSGRFATFSGFQLAKFKVDIASRYGVRPWGNWVGWG